MNQQTSFPLANSFRRIFRVALLVVCAFGAALSAQNPIPQIIGPVKPQSVAPGSGDFILTVYGANFVPGAVVNWNGKPRCTTFVSRRKLRARILATDIAQNTAGTISVTNPGPGGGNSSASFTQVEVHAPTATIDPGPPLVVSTQWAFAYGPVAVADFNGDGKPDMYGNGILMLGNGDGTFRLRSFTNEYAPFGFAYGDFNGDGKLDLAYVGFDTQHPYNPPREFQVMLGDGTGKFQKRSAYWDGTKLGFRWLTAGDFNGDGKLDLAVIRGIKLDIFLGNGDGTFRHTWEGPFPRKYFGNGELMAAGDFNGDGKLDLVTYDQYGNLNILLGKGDGTFRYPAIAVPPSPLSACGPVIVDDFNRDGKLDLAMCTRSLTESQIAVWLGNGDGTFQQPATYTVSPTSVFEIASGDFNSDGITDFIVGANQFSIFLGNGDGTFQAQQVVNPTNGLGFFLIPGDFNRDGLLDFLGVSTGYEGLVYLQQ